MTSDWLDSSVPGRPRRRAGRLPAAPPRPPRAELGGARDHRGLVAAPARRRPASGPVRCPTGHRADLRHRRRRRADGGCSGPTSTRCRSPDEKDVPYRSTVPGVCHACGHDVHTTILLGAGLALARQRATGARAGCGCCSSRPRRRCPAARPTSSVEAGLLDGVGVDLRPALRPQARGRPVGLRSGRSPRPPTWSTSACHGPRRPHRPPAPDRRPGARDRRAGHRPARRASRKLTDSRDAVNITFGSIEAGDAPNVIPTEAALRGTLRAAGRTELGRRPEPARAPHRRDRRAVRRHLGARLPAGRAAGRQRPVGGRRCCGPPRAPTWPGPALRADRAERRAARTSRGSSSGARRLRPPRASAPPGAPVVDIHAGAFDVDERAIPLGARLLAGSALAALGRARRRLTRPS